MTRHESDPRVRKILAAFDRQATSPARSGSTLCMFMQSVADTGCDRFIVPGGWTDEGIRAVLLAFLVNAPDEDLDEMLEEARGENE